MTAMEQALAWGQWLQTYKTVLMYSVGGVIVLLLVVSAWAGPGTRRDTHGSSRWATRWEAKRGGLVRRRGYPLGKLSGRMLRVVNRHILLCGGTGSRKDRSHNFEFTAGCPWSMVIVDVKDGGENYLLCGKYRQRQGPVNRIKPGDPSSHAFNPLSVVRVGTPHEFRDVMFLMQTLLAPAKKDLRGSDAGAFFERRGAIAGRGVLLYVLHSLPPAQQTLTDCHHLMQDAEKCLEAMCQHTHTEVKAQGERLRTLLRTADRQFAAEWSTAQDALDIFADPLIEAVTNRSDFRLEDLQFGKRPMTLYLGAESPTDLSYLYPLYRLILQSAYRVLTGIPPGRKRYHLTMLLNEFNELGWMDILERAPAHARSSKIWFVVVVQALGQLWATYGYDTPLFDNLGVKIFHAPDNDTTAYRLAQMLGDETITTESRTVSERRSRTRHMTARKLLTQTEVQGLGAEQVLVWAGLQHPLLLRKPTYWERTT